MKIANISRQGRTAVAVSDGKTGWIDFSAALADMRPGGPRVSSVQSLFDLLLWDEPTLRKVHDHGASRAEFQIAGEPRFLAPFARPGQIIALARNYSAHAKESTLPIPHEPIFFCKANTSVAGPGEAVILPPNLGRVEPEIELAIVISKEASHVPAAGARDYVAGYTILNDVSAQELQAREIRESYPLFRCKSLRTFTPMGPSIVTVDEAGIEPELDMVLRVNGEARVTTNTRGLTFGVPRLIEFISGYVVLMPGDIITTGCPKAAGAICPGDEMALEIEKIGILRNPVAAGTELCPA
jgi:2-keto-4-pentenoate hydratase/2-oxohepta-3-ene-1,7-dioic acid hydratase in catechol pathway